MQTASKVLYILSESSTFLQHESELRFQLANYLYTFLSVLPYNSVSASKRSRRKNKIQQMKQYTHVKIVQARKLGLWRLLGFRLCSEPS